MKKLFIVLVVLLLAAPFVFAEDCAKITSRIDHVIIDGMDVYRVTVNGKAKTMHDPVEIVFSEQEAQSAAAYHETSMRLSCESANERRLEVERRAIRNRIDGGEIIPKWEAMP